MANSLIRSNRDKNINELIKPKNMSSSKKIEELEKKTNTTIEKVTFDTNLRITNHARNKLIAISSLGYASNQKEVLEVILNDFIRNLTTEEQKEVELELSILEKKDARKKRANLSS